MKPRCSNKRTIGLTRFEVGVVIAVLMIAVALLLPGLLNARRHASRINCVNNLKQVGIAYRIWEGDNGDKYPMGISVTNGGAMELAATGDVLACFMLMSNELSTPKILVCPADTNRIGALTFAGLTASSNISYFVGVDATSDMNPQMFLSGDGNFEIRGVPAKAGLLKLWTNDPVAWTTARHNLNGNIGLADGSVQQTTIPRLHELLQQTGLATNRLAIP